MEKSRMGALWLLLLALPASAWPAQAGPGQGPGAAGSREPEAARMRGDASEQNRMDQILEKARRERDLKKRRQQLKEHLREMRESVTDAPGTGPAAACPECRRLDRMLRAMEQFSRHLSLQRGLAWKEGPEGDGPGDEAGLDSDLAEMEQLMERIRAETREQERARLLDQHAERMRLHMALMRRWRERQADDPAGLEMRTRRMEQVFRQMLRHMEESGNPAP